MASDGAGGRRDGRTTETKSRLRKVALDLFIERGFSHTTLEDIAAKLGITRAALYYHFPSKTALVRELVQPAVDDVDAFLADAEETKPTRRELLTGFFDLNYSHRRVFLALTRDPTGLAVVDAEGWVLRLAEQFQSLLAGTDADIDRRVRAIMAANGLSRAATLLTEIPYEDLRTVAINAAIDLVGDE